MLDLINQNMESPLISVIVPVYNVQDYLERCVTSLLNQTYHNLEIILIDDGSTDDSLMLCKGLSEKDARIRILSQSNQGVGAVRNLGVSMATGQYLGFVDGDDWVDVDMYESLLNLILKQGADVACCAHYREMDGGVKVVGGGTGILEFSCQEAFEALRQERFILNFLWDKLFKRELFSEILFPQERRFEDLIVAPQWLYKTDKVVYLPQPKYHYFIRPGSLTNKPKEDEIQWRYDMVKALVVQRDFCKKYGLWKCASGKLFRTSVHLINRLLFLPATSEYKQIHNFCMQIIREKNSVKGLGFNYLLKKCMLMYCWFIYSHLYYSYKMLQYYIKR